jgi:hypothetical protein
MIWRNVKSKVKISVLNLVALKVQVVMTYDLDELAECLNKRDEYQKQGQDLNAQLDRTQSTSCDDILFRGISEVSNKAR